MWYYAKRQFEMIEYENLSKLNDRFSNEFNECFQVFLDKGWFILGEQVSQFEFNFATYIGARHCVGLANGLDALTISLNAFNFKVGSEVIVPANTYIATILAIINAGLKPILVEPDISTYNLDPNLIEEAVTNKTVAILVVHLYGKCCEMDKISELSKRHGLKIIEDCAQAHGAKFRDSRAGTFGDVSAFSFYPTKNLGALGDAGGICTNSDELSHVIRMMRNYGSKKKYYNEIFGVNSRLAEIQAMFLDIKLKYLDELISHKRMLASLYFQFLKDDFIKPEIREDYFDVYHIFNIRHPRRDALKDFLFKNGILTEIHYPVPPHNQEAFKNSSLLDKKDYPISEEIHRTTLSLPISLIHKEEDVLKVVEVLNRF
jgi:dTDP-4-amino-4,6-dideoxygalactose transaminase